MRVLQRLCRFKFESTACLRRASTKVNFVLEEEIENQIENDTMKPRKNPGIIKNGIATLPDWVVKGISECLQDSNIGKVIIYDEAKNLKNYLFSRLLPTEESELKKKQMGIEEKMLKKKMKGLTDDEIETLKKQNNGKVLKKMYQTTYCWKPLEFNVKKCLGYIIARGIGEYAAVYSILNEIKVRDPGFVPKTLFDFGSGMGSVFWAFTSHWKIITEYVGIDISTDFHNLARKIYEKSPVTLTGYFHREYLPVSNLNYDIVVSAYSLIELHSMKARLEVVSRLWKKTSKYLIIIEPGNSAGFKIIEEARDFILHLSKKSENKEDVFVFAPCPHDLKCPKMKEEITACCFTVPYYTPPILGTQQQKKELFSYVVFKKGAKRSEEDEWSRIIRPVKVRNRHASCRLCTAQGNLANEIFTPGKSGKSLYRCAKSSQWGHRLPVKAEFITVDDQPDVLNEKLSNDDDQSDDTDSDNSDLESSSPVNSPQLNKKDQA